MLVRPPDFPLPAPRVEHLDMVARRLRVSRRRLGEILNTLELAGYLRSREEKPV